MKTQKHLHRNLVFAAMLTLCYSGPKCLAQHADIEFEVVDNRITLTEGVAYSSILLGDGIPPLPAPPPTSTDEPGFAALDGAFSPGAPVGLRVVQPLHYWINWTVTNPTLLSTFFRLVTASGDGHIQVDRSGLPTPNSLNFAVADEDGGIHQHILFELPEPTAPDGAYGVVMQLTSPGLIDSPPFVAVFAQRIDGAQLAQATEAIVAAAGVADDVLLADFNLDQQVNAADLTAWGRGFGRSSHALLSEGDADRDGAVGGGDFLAWQRMFGSTAAISAVPEPTTVMLASVAFAALVAIGVRGKPTSCPARQQADKASRGHQE